MENKWIYDLTSANEALDSLSKFLNISKISIRKFLDINTKQDLDITELHLKMREIFEVKEENLKIDNIEIKGIHVTTGNDNGASIFKHGLLNLQGALSESTSMRNFLIERKINIDISNKLITYKGDLFKIKDSDELHGYINNLVYHKLYNDYLINGFHCRENPIKYDGNVAYNPEFIGSLGRMLGYNDLEHEWKQVFNECYIIEFKASPYKYEWFNYQIDNISRSQYESDRDYHIKNWLIRQSINVICYEILGWSKPEIFCYLNFNEKVPGEDIIRVLNVTEERD